MAYSHRSFSCLAVSSMPSGWDLIGMSFVEGLAGTVNHTLNAFVSRLVDNSPDNKKSKSSSGGFESSEDYAEPNPGLESTQQRANRRTYAKAPELMAQVKYDGTPVDGLRYRAFIPAYSTSRGSFNLRLKRILLATGQSHDTRYGTSKSIFFGTFCKPLGRELRSSQPFWKWVHSAFRGVRE